jgi:RHS repeat-associated protein
VLSQGEVVERYTYDAFGRTRIFDAAGGELTQSAFGNPYMFTGRRYDPETGLYHYRARAYSPDLGRFLQPDPIGYADSMNLYAYCLNNPINLLDPFGTDVWVSGGWHESINVGDPKGYYTSYSFGLKSRWHIFYGPWRKGIVYEDDSSGPAKRIEWRLYLKLTKEQDRIIRQQLDAQIDEEAGYDFWTTNCRTFARDLFKSFKEHFEQPQRDALQGAAIDPNGELNNAGQKK